MNRPIVFLNENGSVITAESIPDLDEWGWDSFWDCAQWIQWHKALTQKYKSEGANIVFAKFWNEQTFGAHALGCRTVDSAFRNYISTVPGLEEIVWQSAEGLKYVLKPVGVIMQTGEVVGGGVAQAIQTTGKTIKWVLPAVFGLGVLGLIWYGSRVARKKRV